MPLIKRLFALSLLLPLLTGCKTWNFYVPQDKQTRKDQQLDFSMGRSFAGTDAICVEVNLINWTKHRLKIPRSAVVLRSAGDNMPIIQPVDIVESETFRRGVYNYYERPGQRVGLVQWAKRLYAPATLVLRPRNTNHTKVFCYRMKQRYKGPFSLHLEGVQVNGKTVRVKPFRLVKMKKPDDE